MAGSLAAYEATWNDEDMGIDKVYRKIERGEFPDTLQIFHPNHGTISIGGPGLYGADYTVSRQGPPLNGTRGGISRTFGNTGLDRDELLGYINEIFTNLQDDLHGPLFTGRQKLLRTQLEAAKKMANQAEGALGVSVPREVRNRVAQMLGERRPVPGAYVAPNNMAKINTSLFSERRRRNRKTRRGNRKSRKSTRRTNRK